MELSVTTFITLDGVYQAPGGPEEDPGGGFTHGGWSVPFGDDAFGEFMISVFDRVDAFLLGRRTYEIFAGYWPEHDDPADPIAHKLNSLPKYVATRTLDQADWFGSELLHGDLVKEVTELKARPGHELQVHGSGDLVHTLLANGLVDTLNILTFPVILGSGKRLFVEGAQPTGLALTESRTTPAGVIIGTYRKQGAPVYGDYSDEGSSA
ncbi:dihydrofolate reductase [Nocardia uniformis]|uniref:Dihydrofolate reductase n=1 Tax=Nocardia uniformis TaxID=53432 RepID=A0A849C6F1_9NOCA|nr:dihydrofolate reductase family protein [Nocardia uniformis]NNH74313.1 dihydrofolate reductase [Nocardia uniformis]